MKMAMPMMKRIYRKSAIILVPMAAVSVFYDWKRMLLSVAVGGMLALVNLRALARSVKGLLGSGKAAAKMMALSFIRLIMLFVILFLLFKYGRVNPIGVLIGFTLIFSIILVEGAREAKTQGKDVI